jgi:4-hydroxy-4-methyl-2-oxoglutarate aldolase
MKGTIYEHLRRVPTASISDALENLGIPGRSGSGLPRLSGAGPAAGHAVLLEVHDREGSAPGAPTRLDGLNDALDGLTVDALVIFVWRATAQRSVIGGLAARTILNSGAAGVLNDGFLRDVEDMRSMGLRVWGRSITPLTGRRDLRVVEVTDATFAGIPISRGDAVVVDDTGVCSVPRSAQDDVLREARRIELQERRIDALLNAGESMEAATQAVRAPSVEVR